MMQPCVVRHHINNVETRLSQMYPESQWRLRLRPGRFGKSSSIMVDISTTQLLSSNPAELGGVSFTKLKSRRKCVGLLGFDNQPT